MCGIVGIYSHKPVAEELYDSLIHLQHRGQDAAGILTYKQKFNIKNGLGLVREVFKQEDILALQGNIGIAHTRYPTSGGAALADVQPLWIGSPRGIALAHNGNIINQERLSHQLIEQSHRHLYSTADSEILLHILAQEIDKHIPQIGYDEDFFKALCNSLHTLFKEVQGAYSIVSVIMGKGLLVFRDPNGLRPLVMGERSNLDGTKDYLFASETSMFYALGYEYKGDVEPGEVIFVNLEGALFRKIVHQETFNPCVFEYVYFARPDSTINKISVYNARKKMGFYLAKNWREKYPDILPDVIIPAPYTSNTAALAFAKELNIPYAEGLYKNPFIGRTFIMPKGKKRGQNVRYKLTVHRSEMENKKVLILDDSIVRGTTSREIVKLVRECEAKEVYYASACPPIQHPCFYGIDIPTHEELIAFEQNETQIKKFLDVDILLYQNLGNLVRSVSDQAPDLKNPCMACMDGNYIAGKKVCFKKNEVV